MKVCDVVFDSIWFDPRVRRQMIEYAKNGVEVHGVGWKCGRYNVQAVDELKKLYPIHLVGDGSLGKGNPIKKAFERIKQFNDMRKAIIDIRPDVIHANDLYGLIPAFAAQRKLKCRVVYDSHEINVENYTGKRNGMLAGIMRALESYMVHRIDLMVCVSHAAAEYFEKEYNIPRPMVVTNSALRSDCVDLSGVEKVEGFEVLNHGQFYEGRGYDIMAEACELIQEYPEIHLAVRGFGKLEESLRKTVSGKKNPEQFAFYPKVKVQELIPLAARSHVGVAITEPICLNFKLSVSNKLFEYAAASLPVILSDIPEHRYLNDQYDFGLIIPEDTPEALAEAIIRLYTDRELYERLSKNALRLSEEVNWENEFGRLIDAERAMTAQK